jgi:hypothetical protein
MVREETLTQSIENVKLQSIPHQSADFPGAKQIFQYKCQSSLIWSCIKKSGYLDFYKIDLLGLTLT